jgi:hypothetical protein
MPELLEDGMPERASRSKFDFSQWVDGQAWKFTKGQDYDSSTETFRSNVKRWAKDRQLEVEVRPVLAVDRDGQPIPLSKADAVALAVRFMVSDDAPATLRRQAA